MNHPEKIYGYITLQEKRYAFTLDGFIGRIFNGVSGFRFSEKVKLPDILYGVTDNNYNIALHIKNSTKVINCIRFSVDYYAVGSANLRNYDLSKFDSIEFIGGTGNCILDPELIYPPFEFEDNMYEKGCCIKFKPLKEVTKKYNVSVGGTQCIFKSSIFPYSERKDNKLGVTNSVISLKFENEQPLKRFEECYFLLTKIVALLVRQQNIEFDKIVYYFKDEAHKGYANIYVNHGFKDIVDKKPIRTISLRSVDRVFSKFIEIIDSEDFSTNFLPDNNTDAHYVTYNSIKNICTALEFEFAKSKIKKEKEEIITKLIKKVKKVVKEYKEETPALTEKAYQSIVGSISKWTFPAAEQFFVLYEANKEVVDRILSHKNLEITEDLIQKFVKCRNDVTHGEKPKLTPRIADTSYSMVVLIYVALFKRIGLDNEEIYKAFEMVF